MNPYAVSSLLAGISSLSLGIFVLYKSANRKLGWVWFLFSISVAVYGFGATWFSSSKTEHGALVSICFCYGLGVVWIASLFYHFVCTFLEIDRKWAVIVNYCIAGLFLPLLPTKLFFRSAQWVFNSMYYPLGGTVFPLFFIWWMSLVFFSHYLLARSYRDLTIQKQNQIKYFFLATAIGFTGGSMSYLPNLGIYIYPWGNFTVCLYPLIMAYAIAKHRLMDVNVIIRKTLIYSLVTGVLATIMLFVAMVSAHFTEGYLGQKTFYAFAIAACLITVIFHPLQRKIQMLVDRYFFSGWSDREMVREVAAGFSHELKSPLAGLSMQVQQTLMELEDLEKGKLSLRQALPKIRQDLNYLLSKAMDAARRIEAVRGVAEPAAEQLEQVNVLEVLDASLSSFSSRLKDMNVRVNRDLRDSLPTVQSNGKQLEIAFINLIKNALDAMDGVGTETARKLSVSGQVRDGHVLVSFKDTGPGISSKVVGRLFEPYFTTKGHKGTGIGLYLTQQIVKAHGGTIEVKSEEGAGTEFIVSLVKYVPGDRSELGQVA